MCVMLWWSDLVQLWVGNPLGRMWLTSGGSWRPPPCHEEHNRTPDPYWLTDQDSRFKSISVLLTVCGKINDEKGTSRNDPVSWVASGKTENVVYRPRTKRFKRQTWDASRKIGRQNFDIAHQGYIVGMCRVLREGKNWPSDKLDKPERKERKQARTWPLKTVDQALEGDQRVFT